MGSNNTTNTTHTPPETYLSSKPPRFGLSLGIKLLYLVAFIFLALIILAFINYYFGPFHLKSIPKPQIFDKAKVVTNKPFIVVKNPYSKWYKKILVETNTGKRFYISPQESTKIPLKTDKLILKAYSIYDWKLISFKSEPETYYVIRDVSAPKLTAKPKVKNGKLILMFDEPAQIYVDGREYKTDAGNTLVLMLPPDKQEVVVQVQDNVGNKQTIRIKIPRAQNRAMNTQTNANTATFKKLPRSAGLFSHLSNTGTFILIVLVSLPILGGTTIQTLKKLI